MMLLLSLLTAYSLIALFSTHSDRQAFCCLSVSCRLPGEKSNTLSKVKCRWQPWQLPMPSFNCPNRVFAKTARPLLAWTRDPSVSSLSKDLLCFLWAVGGVSVRAEFLSKVQRLSILRVQAALFVKGKNGVGSTTVIWCCQK